MNRAPIIFDQIEWQSPQRDLDPPEAKLLAESPIATVSPAQILACLPEPLDRARLENTLGYLHLDLDVLDPTKVGQANFWPVPGGLSVEELTAGIAAIRDRVQLGAVALASYAPEYDSKQGVCRAAFAALDAVLGMSTHKKG